MPNQYKYPVIFCLSVCSICFCQDSSRVKIKKFDWLRFNVQGALIMNSSFSNLSDSKLSSHSTNHYTTTTSEYTPENSKPICLGFQGGLELVLGSAKKIVNGLFSLNYELTNSNFNRNRHTYPYGNSHSTYEEIIDLKVARQVECFGLSAGTLFNLPKGFKFSVALTMNKIYKQTDIMSGYDMISSSNYVPFSGTTSKYDSISYNNTKIISRDEGNGLIGSLRLRVSYGITKYLSIFTLGNFGIGYKAPWWMIGIQYYPFKKLQ